MRHIKILAILALFGVLFPVIGLYSQTDIEITVTGIVGEGGSCSADTPFLVQIEITAVQVNLSDCASQDPVAAGTSVSFTFETEEGSSGFNNEDDIASITVNADGFLPVVVETWSILTISLPNLTFDVIFLGTICLQHAEPDIEVTPPSVDFGEVNVGSNNDRTLTIRNDGDADLFINSILLTQSDSPFNLGGITYTGFSLAPGESSTFRTFFTPHTAGEFTNHLEISSNDPDPEESTIVVPLLGKSQSTPGVLRGFKYEDRNGNGIWEGNPNTPQIPGDEPTLENWLIYLTNAEGVVEQVALTDENGEFAFEITRAGTYSVTEELRKNWKATTPTSNTLEVRLINGETFANILFGNKRTLLADLDVDSDRTGDIEGDYGDEDAEGAIEEKDSAIVLPNLDDDDLNDVLDFEDDTSGRHPEEVKDWEKIIVRQLHDLPAGATVTLEVSNSDASDILAADEKIRIFKKRESGNKADLQIIFSGQNSYEIPENDPDGGIDLETLRQQDFVIGVEWRRIADGTGAHAGEVELSLKIGGTPNPIPSDIVLLRVAPFLLLPNCNTTKQALVADMGFQESTDYVEDFWMAATGSARPGTLDPNTDPIIEVSTGDRWVQDEWEIGYAEAPCKMRRTDCSGFIQLVLNLPRDRSTSLNDFPRKLLGPNFGVIEDFSGGLGAVNYGGNIEVSGPISGFKLGKIIIGNPGSARSGGPELMDSKLYNFLKSQGVQPIVELDTQWLQVGHVDEFLQFVPVPDTSDKDDCKVVFVSTELALDILRNLNDNGMELLNVFRGTHEQTVANLLDQSQSISKRFVEANERIQSERLDPTKARLMGQLGLRDSDFIEVPALFAVDFNLAGSAPAGCMDCIAFSNPASSSSNTGTASIDRVLIDPQNTLPPILTWTITFISASDYEIAYSEPHGTPVPDGTGSTGTNFTSNSGVVDINRVDWDGAPMAGDRFTFSTGWTEQFKAWFPGMANLLVFNNRVVLPDPFGPIVGGVDQFQKAARDKLVPLGLTVNFIDNVELYHEALGQVHCGSNRIMERRSEPEFRWWE